MNIEYTKDNPLTVAELFSGYGSQRMALERLKRNFPPFDYKVVAIAEIDKFALAAYKAVHGDCPNVGDVSSVEWENAPDFELASWSFPCTDISAAGKQYGFSQGSGTRSSLAWEALRCFRVKRPKFLLMENVKALVQKKFMPDFILLQKELEQMGYTNFWQVLNAKDFGIPQNRERVFMVSMLDPDRSARYHFPKPFPLEKRLLDVLDENVAESYYLKGKQVQRILAHCERKQAEGCGFKANFTPPDGISGTITSGI